MTREMIIDREKTREKRPLASDPFQALVERGKALMEEQGCVNWSLGELASQIDKDYAA
jgi:hypothetical protein